MIHTEKRKWTLTDKYLDWQWEPLTMRQRLENFLDDYFGVCVCAVITLMVFSRVIFQ